MLKEERVYGRNLHDRLLQLMIIKSLT